MNRVRKLTSTSLSFLGFALCGDLVYALGLGPLELHSHLNAPLEAEISIQDTKGIETNEIIVHVADRAIFTSMGLEPPSWASEIQLEVVPSKVPNQLQIRIKTQSPIKDPFADLVIELAWPGGKLVREYTVLLDPPKAILPTSAPTFGRRASKEVSSSQTVRSTGAPFSTVGQKPLTPGEEYGPVGKETLWSIAKRLVHNTPYTVHQGLVAIADKNPQAFSGKSVHTLREGAILSLPTLEEIAHYQQKKAINLLESNQQTHTTETQAANPQAKFSEAVNKPLKLVAPLSGERNTSGLEDLAPAGLESNQPISQRISLIEEAIDTLKRTNEDIAKKNQYLESENQSLVALLAKKEQEINQLKENHKGELPLESAPFQTDLSHQETPVAIAKSTIPVEAATVAEQSKKMSPPAAKIAEAMPVAIEKSAQQPKIEKPVLPQVKEPAMQLEKKSKAKHDVFFLIFILAFIGSICGWLWFSRQQLLTLLFKVLKKKPFSEEQPFNPAQGLLDKEIQFDLHKALSAVANEEKRLITPKADPVIAESSDSIKNVLEEAEIYIAYERYSQAEEVLKALLKKQPDQSDALLKLMQLYVLIERYDDFKAVYETSGKQLKEKAPALWQKVVLLAERVDIEKPMGFPVKMASAQAAGLSTMPSSHVMASIPSSAPPVTVPIEPATIEPASVREELPPLPLTLTPIKPAVAGSAGSVPSGIPEVSKLSLAAATPTQKPTADLSIDVTSIPAMSPTSNESQLPLAQAFMDIGDNEAARDLLIAILAEGSENEKAKAQELLNKINK